MIEFADALHARAVTGESKSQASSSHGNMRAHTHARMHAHRHTQTHTHTHTQVYEL